MKQIYYNGKVYTGSLPLVQAFAVEDGQFVFAGSDEEAKKLAQQPDQLVDLEGRFVCSGFNDSHMHLLGLGKMLTQANLAAHTDSLEGMLSYLKEYAALKEDASETESSSWILGRGWNQDYFADADRMPDRHDLDKVSAQRPVCIIRACGHCLAVNTKALELLGITKETPQPDGGRIGMEKLESSGTKGSDIKKGETELFPDGRFYDNAMELVYAAIPAPELEEIKAMIRAACRMLNSYGITSCQSDDYCVFANVSPEVINQAFAELEKAGELTVRVYEQSNLTTLTELQKFVEAGNVTGTGSDHFRFGPLKMLGDGALGARTAFLSQPYADEPATCGIPVFSRETFEEMIGYAHANGMQAAVHTIGDACLDWVLSAYEKALQAQPRKDHRHGIVHCQITRPDQLQKIQDLNLHVYAQSIFLDYDINIVESRVGKELASTSYSWKTLAEGGVRVSNGSDCPVELPDVMAGIQCSVTRRRLKDTKEQQAYLEKEAFSVQEALDSFTKNGAYASFEENKKGQIKEGMLADFTVLAKNPFETDPYALKDITICSVYLGGKEIYSGGQN